MTSFKLSAIGTLMLKYSTRPISTAVLTLLDVTDLNVNIPMSFYRLLTM